MAGVSGPAIANLATLSTPVIVFVVAMAVGTLAHDLWYARGGAGNARCTDAFEAEPFFLEHIPRHARALWASQSPFLKFPFLAPRGAPGLNPPCKLSEHRLHHLLSQSVRRLSARLWRDQGKRDAARDLLAPVAKSGLPRLPPWPAVRQDGAADALEALGPQRHLVAGRSPLPAFRVCVVNTPPSEADARASEPSMGVLCDGSGAPVGAAAGASTCRCPSAAAAPAAWRCWLRCAWPRRR